MKKNGLTLGRNILLEEKPGIFIISSSSTNLSQNLPPQLGTLVCWAHTLITAQQPLFPGFEWHTLFTAASASLFSLCLLHTTRLPG